MTKSIRIENADTSNWKVKVEIWTKTAEGDILEKTVEMNYPTMMVQEYIHDGKWLVIKENGQNT